MTLSPALSKWVIWSKPVPTLEAGTFLQYKICVALVSNSLQSPNQARKNGDFVPSSWKNLCAHFADGGFLPTQHRLNNHFKTAAFDYGYTVEYTARPEVVPQDPCRSHFFMI